MKSIIFIAPPSAGKGTQSLMVSEKYHMPHISTGDLLRAASKEKSERGTYIKNQMETGGLVSDEITLELLKERLKKDDCNNGYILDGFPRNVSQAKAYEDLLKSLKKDFGVVIILDLDKQTALDRVIGRLTCGNCGAVYNEKFEESRPKKSGICDKCGNALSKRSDDNAETFEKRYDTYVVNTEPLIQYYEEKGNVYHINSGDPKEIVFSNIEKVLGGK